MIQNTEEKIVTVSGDWSVNEIQQFKNDKWWSYVRYVCVANGAIIDTFSITYNGDEYNTWFENYTSGIFLLEELVRVKGWDIIVDGTIEDEFFNAMHEVVEEVVEEEPVEEVVEEPEINGEG